MEGGSRSLPPCFKQAAEKAGLLPTRPLRAGTRFSRASFSHRSGPQRTEKILGGRKHWRGFSVRQDPFKGRTAPHEARFVPPRIFTRCDLAGRLFEQPVGEFPGDLPSRVNQINSQVRDFLRRHCLR